MFTLIEFIGLLDRNGNPHGVTLHPGLNLITGRSATGKSSLIEIFDYCMGGSQNTIPTGIISDNAEIFCTMLQIRNGRWILARRLTKYYIIDANAMNVKSKNDIKLELFDTSNLNRVDFIYKLNLIYGLDISDMIETEDDKKRKGMVGAPSIRNAMSYILQHQNLIANKLALFYRFDEREKKEQTIEQFKIFAKFVDAQYYSLLRDINTLKKDVERLKRIVDEEKELMSMGLSQIENEYNHYVNITGKTPIDYFSLDAILNNPAKYLERLNSIDFPSVEISEDNQKYIENYKNLQLKKNKLEAELRRTQLKIIEIESTINTLNEYKSKLLKYQAPKEIKLDYSICPFCHQHTELVEVEANRLTDAINRVNHELLTLQPLIRPQYQVLSKIITERDDIILQLNNVDKELEKLFSIINELHKNNSLMTQAFKVVLRLQGLIENIAEVQNKSSQLLLNKKETELRELNNFFDKRYQLKRDMLNAENSINQYISKYRKNLPFEERFDEYELIFNLNNFELNFIKDKDIIKMRNIGSGSNWLNAHLCLFLALGSFFKTIDDSIIPSVIFFDQPSQVYFPSKDDNEQFTPNTNPQNNDDDIIAVSNIFQTLYRYCVDHKNTIQIIVTDHADYLTIDGLENFNSIVAARWRDDNQGLVDMTIIE